MESLITIPDVFVGAALAAIDNSEHRNLKRLIAAKAAPTKSM